MRTLPINSAQRGAALLVVLVLLVAMMLIGLTAFYSSKQEERLARAGRDGLLARRRQRLPCAMPRSDCQWRDQWQSGLQQLSQ
jgi:hypothetical protein